MQNEQNELGAERAVVTLGETIGLEDSASQPSSVHGAGAVLSGLSISEDISSFRMHDTSNSRKRDSLYKGPVKLGHKAVPCRVVHLFGRTISEAQRYW